MGRAVRRARHLGVARHCSVCSARVRAFARFGDPEREDARCPVCHSLERHRLAWLFLERCTPLFDGRRRELLHFAPEPVFAERLRRIPGVQHLGVDLADPRADLRLDITRLPFADGERDVIFCSHVLEHVPDDRKALRELARVLEPSSGWMILQVPLRDAPTDEDPTVTDPAERTRRFGQSDHVRVYGWDFTARLRAAGFDVAEIHARRWLGARDAARYGLADEALFYCTRTPDDA